jgi:guanine nucleotide-binding protein subunit alpha
VSLSCYDQALDRDPDENQMDDTFNAFSLVAKNDTLKDIPIILFLNKIDLFKKKIETSPISKYFPDYKDEERNFKKGCEFFEKKFRAVIPNKKRELYVYKTHATDTNQISAILQAVTDIMLRRVVMNL